MRTLIIGTRASELARWQASFVAETLQRAHRNVMVELQLITTQGDRMLQGSLAAHGGKGLFVSEIEQALQRKEIDLAVHSLKDVPAELAPGLKLSAIPERADPRDVVVTPAGGLDGLAAGAKVGTSSLRRRAQLLAAHPKLQVVEMRGNVDTRLRKLREGQCDALLLAAAGLTRLGRSEVISEYLEVDDWIPAGGQGALGIESREEDAELDRYLEVLEHGPTRACVELERDLIAQLGGGCHVPVAAHAVREGSRIRLRGLVGHPSGRPVIAAEATGEQGAASGIAASVARDLLARGAGQIIQEFC